MNCEEQLKCHNNTRNVTTTPRVSETCNFGEVDQVEKVALAQTVWSSASIGFLHHGRVLSRKSEVSVAATLQYFEIFKRIKTLRGRHNKYRRMSSSKPSPSTASGIQCASNSSAAIA
jgi:hypothetical protein